MKIVETVLRNIRENELHSQKTDARSNSNVPSIKLINQTLRHQGYRNHEAINDILDNSIDVSLATNIATEKRIHVDFSFRKNGKLLKEDSYILVGDNGGGFGTKETIEEALRLGSETKQMEENQLGCYGVGLNLAAISMGRLLVVITNTDTGFWTGVMDLDNAIKLNSWDFLSIRPSTDEEIDLTKTYRVTTIVLINKLDRVTNHQATQFKTKIKKNIGETFRYFISRKEGDNKFNIYINGELVKPIDPMCKDREGTKLLNFEDTSNNYTTVINGAKIRLKYYFVAPIIDNDDKSSRTTNMSNQGLYIMRNNRQIKRADYLNLKIKHNDYNFFRGELFFDGADDALMGTNSRKVDINPPDELITTLSKDFSRYLLETKKIYKQNYKPKPVKTVKKDEIDQFAEDSINNNPFFLNHKIEIILEANDVCGEKGVFCHQIPTGVNKVKLCFNIQHILWEQLKTFDRKTQQFFYMFIFTLYDAFDEKITPIIKTVNDVQRNKLIELFFEKWSDNLRETLIAQTT